MGQAAAGGVMTGFCGSLSTVSTWVVELQLLMLTFPAHRRGYAYLGASIAAPVLLGVLIYGTAVWTLPGGRALSQPSA
ncbi:MAG: hypothetical protein J3K34DRAFT_425495 [Monoraphidium minutum]|nr:MAG: hypothetical protein J3K34DRAFT_425495 [Monoraphidium minutum]